MKQAEQAQDVGRQLGGWQREEQQSRRYGLGIVGGSAGRSTLRVTSCFESADVLTRRSRIADDSMSDNTSVFCFCYLCAQHASRFSSVLLCGMCFSGHEPGEQSNSARVRGIGSAGIIREMQRASSSPI